MPWIDAETARELMDYDPDTGKLYWRHRRREWFPSKRSYSIWNARFPGKEIGSFNQGYLSFVVIGFNQKVHRVAWLIHYGEEPNGVIDHINGDRQDNRISNLRVVDLAENTKNKGHYKPSKRMNVGISIDPRTGKFVARIGDKGVTKYIGSYATEAEAYAARKEKERELGYHENHGGRPCVSFGKTHPPNSV